MSRLAVCALACLAAWSCGDLVPPEGPLAELERNLDRWQRFRPVTYEYALARICFCGPDALGPVRLTVVGDDVTSRIYVDSGDSVPTPFLNLFPPVDGLFDVLRAAIEHPAHRIEVTYDPVSGVPLALWIDYEEFVADEELGFSVTEAVVLPQPR